MKNTHHPKQLKNTVFCTALAVLLAACAGTPTGGPVPEGHYRVQHGDTLYRIAKRYGRSVSELAEWNRLSNSARIEAGQVLRVRPKGASGRTGGVTTPGSPGAANNEARAVQPVNRVALQWPVDNAAQNIIQPYNGSTNKGIDIAGAQGQPVKAAAAGKVIYAGEGVRGYGKLVLVSHNRSTITAYAHNDTIAVQENQSVAAGQTIATMGMSETDRVKLHFEVRINGKAVDPMPYLGN
ncbi:peptidoglycan DD-metalloendopeptidase family protein [Neisseria sp.]|uniref:peptidoglycan DD-metalloendopeptidase family protein n=1 Tax=Neisseria sp. TaxID=192066 RepID=UPI00359FC709